MKATKLALALCCLIASNMSLAGPYEWTSYFAQGYTFYEVNDGNNNSLKVVCPGGWDDQYISAGATINGVDYSSHADSSFNVIVDGELWENPFYTECSACSQNFKFPNGFYESFRKANKLQLQAGGQTINLPVKNMDQMFPELDHFTSDCPIW